MFMRLTRLLLVAALSGVGYSQTLTTVTASHINVSGTPIATGNVLLTPVDTNGQPIAFVTGGGGGLNAPKAFSCTVTAGAIPGGCQVPDACATTPANLLYTIDITAAGSTFRLPKVANICGTTWALDAYAPSATTTNTQAVQVTYGASAAPSPCATPSFYYQTGVGLSVCVGGVPVAVTGGTVTASACPLKNATNICITESPYNAVGNGTTDNTAAFLAAITALSSTGGTIWVPDGNIVLNGALQDTGGANAVLPMPKIANYTANMVAIGIRGYSVPVPSTPAHGAVLQTSITTGNLIAGYDGATGGGKAPFTNVWLDIENIQIFDTATNPGATMIDATNLQNLTAKNLLISAAGSSLPTNTAGWAIKYPGSANNVRISVDNVAVGGFYNGFKLGEHSHTGSIYAGNTTNCFTFDPGTNAGDGPIYNNNSISVDYLWGLGCTHAIVGGANLATVNVQVADLEATTGADFYDPSNLIHGIVNYSIPLGANHCAPVVTGATNLQINSLQCSVTVSASNPFLENWKSQDGSGTTLANSGSDSTNAMTATNVTWSTSVTGFAGVPVAVYNGTTSVSQAASATQTAFDGTTPFSACAWFNLSTLTYASGSSAYLMSNLSSATGNPGWRIGIFGTGAAPVGATDVYLISNVGTANYIHVTTSTGSVAANALNLTCVTYDGSKTAAGVLAYTNGALDGMSIVTNGLTGSTVSTSPLYIGGEFDGAGGFPGALGRVRVYSRKLSASEISAMFTAGPNAY